MTEILGITEKEVTVLKAELIRNGIINQEEDILITKCDEIDLKLGKLNEILSSTLNLLKFIFHKLLSQERIPIPLHLHKFVKHHLKEFIKNAKLAMYMEEGIQYLVDMIASNDTISYEPKIIIIDQSTGVDMPSTQWSNGLQQFLQLKHGLRLTPVSLKAVYISSLKYFQKFKQIYGFSGTLGSKKERLQLYDKYNVDLKLVPSSLPNLFYEEPTIIATVKNGCKHSHVDEIFESINKKLNDNRSVLIICESIKQLDELSAAIKEMAVKELDEEKALPFMNATIYRRDYEKFEYGSGMELPPRSIIFSTNLAGRGTNIILTDNLRQNGGLHVIVTFLPKNLRVEEQAFGRAARFGDPGSGQLIIHADNSNSYGNLTGFLQLKLLRNAQDNHRVETNYNYYEDEVDVEEKCFEIFAKHFRETKEKMEVAKVDKAEENLFLQDLLDRWALWADTYPHETLSPKERINAVEKAAKDLKKMPTTFVNELIAVFALQGDAFTNGLQSIVKRVCDYQESCSYKNPVNQRRIAAAEIFCNSLSQNATLCDGYNLTLRSNILKLATIYVSSYLKPKHNSKTI
uniref:Uncharacterized protein n=1 Tax=Panagrolaimus davidi TaxID=227884 RepID=A0A914PA70_9BILA